jgi:hypothetical protein
MRTSFVMMAAAATLMATTASATVVSDASGDFLGTYLGTQDPNLDILSASAVFDGSDLVLGATVNGAIGTPGNLYVFGINRGTGLPRLAFGTPSVGGGILFDAVAVLFPDGTGRIAILPPVLGPPTTITDLPGAVKVSGDSISGRFALSLLPSTGFALSDYTFAMWTRQRANPAVDGTNIEIADFAPDASSFKAVPEPSTWAMMILGFGAVGTAMRRKQKVTARLAF